MSEIQMSVLRGVGGGDGGEISLLGSLQIPIGGSNTYLINDYDSFSEYSARAGSGITVTINHPTQEVKVSVNSGYSGSQITFFVSRNGVEKSFTVATQASVVVTPRIVSPANGSANQSTNLTIQGSSYTTIPSGQGVLQKSRWQISRTQGFTDIIKDETITTGNKEHYNVSGLPIGTELFVRVMYTSSTLGNSSWSATSKFTTIDESISKPTIRMDQPTFDVNETPTFIAGAFTTVPANSDSHLSSSWRIVKKGSGSSETTVYTNNRSMTNRQSLTLPKGVLETSSEYYAQVKFEGSRIGESMWSDKLTFSTATSFVPDELGTPWEGGFYAGRIMVNGQPHAIVMASKVEGGWFTGITWKNTTTTTPNTDSTNDSYANMQGAIAAGISSHPAFNVCYTYRGGGYSDWLLGAKDVVEIMYRNFKPSTGSNTTSSGANPNAIPPTGNYTASNPSQTPLPLFRVGAAEAFTVTSGTYYRQWTSTQYSATSAWNQPFDVGNQYYLNNKTYTTDRSVRPVRIVPID